jgi:mono/diheme cytochrome c family protein
MAQEQSAPASRELPAGVGAETIRARCLVCHGAGVIVQQRLSRDSWSRELDKMAAWGAVVNAAERNVLLDYLTVNFGADAAPRESEATAETGAALVQARCLGCHDVRLIEQQRLDVDGWRGELEKMIGWGAAVTPAEKDALAAHLARRYGAGRPRRP